jgi:hypothetical protein
VSEVSQLELLYSFFQIAERTNEGAGENVNSPDCDFVANKKIKLEKEDDDEKKSEKLEEDDEIFELSSDDDDEEKGKKIAGGSPSLYSQDNRS